MSTTKRRKVKRVKVVETKLGKQRAWGLYYHGENRIEIDKRMKPKKYLGVLIHELLHHHFPWMSESMVTRVAPQMAHILWEQDYRRMAKCKS